MSGQDREGWGRPKKARTGSIKPRKAKEGQSRPKKARIAGRSRLELSTG